MGEAFGLRDDKGKRLRRKISSVSTPTHASQLQRPSTPSETHVILRDNAFFLLQLATSSNPEKNQHTLERRRRSLMHQPLLSSVSESDKDFPHRKISAIPPKVEMLVFIIDNTITFLFLLFSDFQSGYQASGDVLPWLQFQCLAVLKSGCSPQLPTSESNFGDGEIEVLRFKLIISLVIYSLMTSKFKDGSFPRIEGSIGWFQQAATAISLYDYTAACPTLENIRTHGRSEKWSIAAQTNKQRR